MLDSTTTRADKPADHTEAHTNLSAEANVRPDSNPSAGHTSNDSHVQAGTLPALTISGSDSGKITWWSGPSAVAGDLFTGAKNQIVEHPGQVAENGAIGLAIGAGAGIVADGLATGAAAIGLTVAAPEILLGATIAGVAYGAYELYEHVGGWIHAAKVVSDQKDYSADQVASAHTALQGVGAGGVNLAAGTVGGIAGGYLARSFDLAGESAPEAGDATSDGVPPAGEASTTTNPVGGMVPADSTTAQAQNGATPPVDATHTTAPNGATPPVDATHSVAPKGATPPVDATHSVAPNGATPPIDATHSQAPRGGTASSEVLDTELKTVDTDFTPAKIAPTIDLSNPKINTSEPDLRAAFKDAIASAQKDNTPVNFKIDTTVPLKDAAGNPVKLSQADVLYQELQAANPDNHFVFSKPDLNPGDTGYAEFPAPAVTQDGLHISTKENAITLGGDTTLADGSTLPAGTKFAVGTTYDGHAVKSVLPDGKVWATKPDGSVVQVADAGQSAALSSDSLSADPLKLGQVVNAKTADGGQSRIVVRTDAKVTAPDGTPLLDAYPSGGAGFDAAYKEGTKPGLFAPKPKLADHFRLPSNVTVDANTNYGAATASGANNDYFMKSGFADAQGATAKNYSGPTSDARSAAEILRIRKALGLS